MKRYSFLLLEVLIAVSLLIFFVPVLIKIPVHHYQTQVKHFEELEKQRISDWTYSEIKETLLRRSIPWKTLPEKGKEPKQFPLPDACLELPGLPSKAVKRSFTLKCTKEKEGKEGETFRLYELTINVGNSPYKYMLVIQLV